MHRLPREVADTSSLETFEVRLDQILNNLTELQVSLCPFSVQESWTRWPLKIPSNRTILQFIQAPLPTWMEQPVCVLLRVKGSKVKCWAAQGDGWGRRGAFTQHSRVSKPALGAPVPALILIARAHRYLFITANIARERWPKLFGLLQLFFHISNLLKKKKKEMQDTVQNTKDSLKVKLERYFYHNRRAQASSLGCM